MAEFEIAYKLISAIEGGYVNDHDDQGGETYCGIARNYHPQWSGWVIIDNYKINKQLKRGAIIHNPELESMVKDFYRAKFWDSNRLSEIKHQDIANELYDIAVNMGVKTAAIMLQEALNLLNKDNKLYTDIPIDGIIGPQTIKLCNEHTNPEAIEITLNGLQFMKYVDICRKNPSQEKFLIGWLKRV
jgi:lysozyme family protein